MLFTTLLISMGCALVAFFTNVLSHQSILELYNRPDFFIGTLNHMKPALEHYSGRLLISAGFAIPFGDPTSGGVYPSPSVSPWGAKFTSNTFILIPIIGVTVPLILSIIYVVSRTNSTPRSDFTQPHEMENIFIEVVDNDEPFAVTINSGMGTPTRFEIPLPSTCVPLPSEENVGSPVSSVLTGEYFPSEFKYHTGNADEDLFASIDAVLDMADEHIRNEMSVYWEEDSQLLSGAPLGEQQVSAGPSLVQYEACGPSTPSRHSRLVASESNSSNGSIVDSPLASFGRRKTATPRHRTPRTVRRDVLEREKLREQITLLEPPLPEIGWVHYTESPPQRDRRKQSVQIKGTSPANDASRGSSSDSEVSYADLTIKQSHIHTSSGESSSSMTLPQVIEWKLYVPPAELDLKGKGVERPVTCRTFPNDRCR